MGGPGVNLYQPRSKPDAGDWLPQENPGPETWRRTIYLLRVRGADDGVFKPFDVPDCGQVRAKRSASTTPLQALNLFNSPFIVEQAAAAGRPRRAGSGRRRRRQIERVFALTLARAADGSTSAPPASTWREQHGLATVCRALFNSNEFLFLE